MGKEGREKRRREEGEKRRERREGKGEGFLHFLPSRFKESPFTGPQPEGIVEGGSREMSCQRDIYLDD